MRAIQNAGGHVGVTAREYPIAANTSIARGQVVKLSGGKVISAVAAETGAILGIAAENHTGSADALNQRSNGTRILVHDNPGLIFECPVPEITAADSSSTTVVGAAGQIAAGLSNDDLNYGVLVLKRKAANSTNTDVIGVHKDITDYATATLTMTVASGGTAVAGDVFELYPPLGSALCALDSATFAKLVISATGCTKVKVVGYDFDRHMIRCMAVEHALGVEN